MPLANYFKLIRLKNWTGIALLFLPCCWGIALSNTEQYLRQGILFLMGSFIMRSAGCIINDIADRKFDAMVVRTANRPLANKELSIKQALISLIVLLGIALFIWLQLNLLAQIIALCALGLVFLYPYTKRITYWPQVFLGFTFNIGVLVGYANVTDSISVNALFLYLAGVFWTIGYDTIYAFQDIEDDLKIGIKSSAMIFSKSPKFLLGIVYTAFLCLVLVALDFKTNTLLILTWISLISILLWQVLTLNINSSKNCHQRFISNRYVGALVLLLLILGQ